MRLGGKTILRGLDFAITGSGLTAIMGPSGVGKTTLLRIIAGLIRPDAGKRRCQARIATIFQDTRLLPWQSALDNAAFGLRAGGMRAALARRHARGLLERLEFSPDDQIKRPHALSGGMRQRAAIARAIAVEPDLLLMDEPFTGLDMNLRADLQNLVRGIVDERKLAAILVTHDPVEAVTLSDRVIVLGGRPAKKLADLPVSPRPRDSADAYATAADLVRRSEMAAAYNRSGE